MTHLILIRHGETDWNVEGRYQGQADPPLNARGRVQALRLADGLASSGIETLYTSPLQRARQTAEIVAQRLNVPVHIEPRLVEIHQGDWQTRLRSEIEQLYPEQFRRWVTDPWSVSPPNGERLVQVLERVVAAVTDIVRRHPASRVGLVTHRIPIALIKFKYQGLDPDNIRTLNLPNTYYEEIDINPEIVEKMATKEK
ncbi:MAG: histidine phosphatase family protein [Chloroflexi bacterium]|jgi:broad specificity phosphatase PhoE|nr:histidine phosphatase family protein [Chloroflexota bacterium]